MLKLSAPMRWGGRKRDIFAFEPGEETSVPDFSNVTRTSQLARQLVRELAAWMGIEGDPEAERERIGTPSGWLAAQARRSWLEQDGYTKVRSSLVHHLVDAAILSHIPPAAGLNHVRYGGIFFENEQGKTRALQNLGPSITHWLGEETAECPVEKQRSNSRTRSLGDETFWKILPEDEKGKRKTRQRTRLDHNEYQDGIALDTELRRMRIPADKIPPIKALEAWLDKVKGGAEEPLKLLDGTPVRNVHKFGTKGSFDKPLGMSANPTLRGSYQGARYLDGKFDRLELWLGWNKKKSRWEYYTRLVPTKVAVRHLNQTLPGWWAKNRVEVMGKLPPYAKKVGQFRKGDQILLPLSREGEISPAAPYVQWWYEVTALNANGQLEMKSLTLRNFEETKLSHLGAGILKKSPGSPALIASILFKESADKEAATLSLKPPLD
jgi:hypothetical protein